jgi:8-oxo-dGTP pyrophosphatase MutT (NUDIX family)
VKTRTETSAGGVIYRRRSGGVDVCLIATQGGDTWQLPKGLIEPGEAPELAAEREVAEETGLRGQLEGPLNRIEYWYVWNEDGGPVRIHKFVHFFLFRYTGGSTTDHDDEVDDARWFPLEEAATRLRFGGEQSVMRMAVKALEGAAPTQA